MSLDAEPLSEDAAAPAAAPTRGIRWRRIAATGALAIATVCGAAGYSTLIPRAAVHHPHAATMPLWHGQVNVTATPANAVVGHPIVLVARATAYPLAGAVITLRLGHQVLCQSAVGSWSCQATLARGAPASATVVAGLKAANGLTGYGAESQVSWYWPQVARFTPTLTLTARAATGQSARDVATPTSYDTSNGAPSTVLTAPSGKAVTITADVSQHLPPGYSLSMVNLTADTTLCSAQRPATSCQAMIPGQVAGCYWVSSEVIAPGTPEIGGGPLPQGAGIDVCWS